MTIFPILQPVAAQTPLPLFREVRWDFSEDCPIFENGAPVLCEGAQAVAVWAWNALKTVRYRHAIYSFHYGNEAENLIGQAYTDDLKQAEAARYVKECLLQNPYIRAISDISVRFQDSALTVKCKLETIYGTVEL